MVMLQQTEGMLTNKNTEFTVAVFMLILGLLLSKWSL